MKFELMQESPLIIRLREHLNNITPEEFQKEIEEIESIYPACEEDCPHCAYERQESWEDELEKDACKRMTTHTTWFKRYFNPLLRKIFKVEITSLILEGRVIGYGIRKQIT